MTTLTNTATNATDVTPTDAKNEKRLFSSRQVLVATFLGSPLASSILMAKNVYREDESDEAALCVLGGAILTIVSVVAAFLIAGDTGLAIPILQLAVMGFWYKATQQEQHAEHVAAGGQSGSNWTVAGVSLLAVVLVGGFGMAISCFTGI